MNEKRRQVEKVARFAYRYGRSARAIVEQLGVSEEEAEELIRKSAEIREDVKLMMGKSRLDKHSTRVGMVYGRKDG